PDVPVGLGVGAVLAALLEPRVLVAGVVHHEVGHDPQAPGVGLLDQLHGVGQHAVSGQNGEEVGNVVAAVPEGRLVEGQEPDAVDPQPLQVVEPAGEASQVTLAVDVAIGEAPDEDFVEDGLLVPPGVAWLGMHRPFGLSRPDDHAQWQELHGITTEATTIRNPRRETWPQVVGDARQEGTTCSTSRFDDRGPPRPYAAWTAI